MKLNCLIAFNYLIVLPLARDPVNHPQDFNELNCIRVSIKQLVLTSALNIEENLIYHESNIKFSG